jgi:rubrerythrin
MPKTSAERQRDYRTRQAAKRRELARLREENDRLASALAESEAEREQARESRNVTRCQNCGTDLACPSCNRGEDWA